MTLLCFFPELTFHWGNNPHISLLHIWFYIFQFYCPVALFSFQYDSLLLHFFPPPPKYNLEVSKHIQVYLHTHHTEVLVKRYITYYIYITDWVLILPSLPCHFILIHVWRRKHLSQFIPVVLHFCVSYCIYCMYFSFSIATSVPFHWLVKWTQMEG